MTLGRVQPFFRNYNLDLAVYQLNKGRIFPETVKKGNICLYLHKDQFCVKGKLNRKTSLLDWIDEIDKNFEHEQTQINKNILKQVIEYIFPISFEMNCLYSVFAFDLETCNVENSEYCESYAAGLYHLDKFYECFNGDLNEKELAIERNKVHVFDRENSNPV